MEEEVIWNKGSGAKNGRGMEGEGQNGKDSIDDTSFDLPSA